MKKAIFIIAAAGFSLIGHAQDRNVVSAILALKENSFEEAKDDINKAILDPETKDRPKTWSTRGDIYFQMQQTDQYKSGKPYREAAISYMKVEELKPDYNREFIVKALLSCAYLYFNDGISAYNDKKLDTASALMKSVIDIHNLGGGKAYAGNKGFDTVAGQALLVRANCAYFSNQPDAALPMFVELKNTPTVRSASVYSLLIDIYQKENKDAEVLATIQEGRKAFPEDQAIRNDEINYYIKTGKQDELTKKLEDAVAKDPTNAELYYNLGVQYYGMAFPKDKPGNPTYATKSEEAYKTAIKLAPDNAGYNYNLGALYFNEASDVSEQINKITGSSPAEEKKYKELKDTRDGLLNEALPYLEKANSIFEPNAKTLKGEDHTTYISTLSSLKQIYAMQSKMDKVEEIKKKMAAFQ